MCEDHFNEGKTSCFEKKIFKFGGFWGIWRDFGSAAEGRRTDLMATLRTTAKFLAGSCSDKEPIFQQGLYILVCVKIISTKVKLRVLRKNVQIFDETCLCQGEVMVSFA